MRTCDISLSLFVVRRESHTYTSMNTRPRDSIPIIIQLVRYCQLSERDSGQIKKKIKKKTNKKNEKFITAVAVAKAAMNIEILSQS